MKFFMLMVLVITLGTVGCEPPPSKSLQGVPETTNFHPLESPPTRILTAQTVYVPVYSSIHRHIKAMTHLTAILSIRNISEKIGLVISRVDYYDTNGKLIRTFIEKPSVLGAMASKEFIIPESDLEGGTGANFVVRWESEKKISTPIIETVMIGNVGNQGFSFTSRGKEIESEK